MFGDCPQQAGAYLSDATGAYLALRIGDPVIFYPWSKIRDGKNPDLGSGMNIPDHI
jgi:hypothetical protein